MRFLLLLAAAIVLALFVANNARAATLPGVSAAPDAIGSAAP